MSDFSLFGRSLVNGKAEGEILYADAGISFWGGIHSSTGEVIDRHHSLSGQNITGKILAIPGGRGSCTGSSVLLELITNGHAPAALVFSEREEILTLGVIIADVLFKQSIPVLYLDTESFATLERAQFGRLQGTQLSVSDSQAENSRDSADDKQSITEGSTVELSQTDRDGREKDINVCMAVTLGRAVHEQARAAGYISRLETFGALLINDTCWCMIGEPVISSTARTLMTNSGKYAHYAPNLTGRKVHFGSLAACVNAACSGHAGEQVPEWLAAAT
ncbi:DUF126 domain-containing protein [Marinobacter sp. M3C]|jgi:predicted aconitase with swiveling domain|uniref:aconitase X swivel domain-containing protein n=1 Tax=unclassified Marinobacter TaxID=83889 RepID=UPI00200DFE0E|nr:MULTISPECIES: DUF126 domain-containing protein [unclassified Marinobacter]MCL1476676.1 DUF126 domain-containing protein [Marinobacter sp.]MCL1481135.1 DUF126 domain-containing protein [Marinobacter sp.]MCL1485466.1 DUF126 domain-containing protein [Marinobacter sp.]MCL1487996.1 DUF126 domain-containing protein [Marinobacter sp.]UQG56092.1 DUF126 domain-containing protein [Marinobacter sp. M4C]